MDINYNDELGYWQDDNNIYNSIEEILTIQADYFENKDVAYLRIVWNEQIPKRIFDIGGVCYWEF